MTQIKATVLADSSFRGTRLTSLEVTFPRFILAEFNTHRVFSRNSASSRAIPVAKQIAKVTDDPFIPLAFPINKAGMSADEYIYITDSRYEACKTMWLDGRNAALLIAQRMLDAGIHKQIANRVLEPYMEHTCIVSSTQWDNFFDQRISPAAQPEINFTAIAMHEAMETSVPRTMNHGDWHLPLVSDDERASLPEKTLVYVSAGRCARVSYDRQHDTEPAEVTLERAEMLQVKKHWSPWEHVATPALDVFEAAARQQNFRDWVQARWYLESGPGLGHLKETS